MSNQRVKSSHCLQHGCLNAGSSSGAKGSLPNTISQLMSSKSANPYIFKPVGCYFSDGATTFNFPKKIKICLKRKRDFQLWVGRPVAILNGAFAYQQNDWKVEKRT